MKQNIKTIAQHYRQQVIYLWIKLFWEKPDNLWALKVTTAIAVLLIPCHFLNEPFWGNTLALGVVGGALAETDDHPRGRAKTLLVTIISFLIVSASVELLRPFPWFFGLGLALTTFSLILLGGVNPRYQGVTFGALLVSIYTMLGTGIMPWYFQPILLPTGALMYGSISLVLLYIRPFRLLEEQLSTAFTHLAQYITLKASLFPSTAREQARIRMALAQKNIEVGRSIDSTKQVIYACIEKMQQQPKEELMPYYYKWLLLQQLHERATSSHERYELLSRRCENPLLIEGFGKLLREIAHALQHYAESLLTGSVYHSPLALKWTAEALHSMLAEETKGGKDHAALLLLFHNLERTAMLLQNADHVTTSIPIETLNYQSPPLRIRIKEQINTSQARFRHAIRLVVCFVTGYILINLFEFQKGDWVILTSLFVCQQTYTATRQRLFQRIAGTVFGVFLGILLTSLLPTTMGQIILLLTSIFAFFYWLRKRYYVSVIFITVFVVAAFNIQTGAGVNLMGARLLDTIIGSLLAFLVVRFLWPDWQYKHLPILLYNAVEKNNRYLDTIVSSHERGQGYYHNRRTAHLADNALTTAWKGMFLEPKSKRFMQKKAYELTYINHTLLSYISALGAHYFDQPLTESQKEWGIKISGVFQNIKLVLSKRMTTEEAASILLESKKLDMQLWQHRQIQQQDEEDKALVLLYNILHSAIDLLSEAQLLQQYRANYITK